VPVLTRWFIKCAMLYLIVALALSILMQSGLSRKVPLLGVLWPTYLHLLVVGWLTQLIFGVAFWMFPKHPSAPRVCPAECRGAGGCSGAGVRASARGSVARPYR